jgi:hypothetical protein
VIRDEINSAMAGKMAAQLDTTIKSALDRHWGVWSTEDLKRRCTLVSRPGSEVQTLYADGKPILEIHPIQLETVRTDTGWTLKATQNYRTL